MTDLSVKIKKLASLQVFAIFMHLITEIPKFKSATLYNLC